MSEQEVVNESSEPANEALPDWAREQLTKANREAAKYRTEKNEAVDAAKAEAEAAFRERIEGLEAQIAEKESEGSAARTEVDRIKAALGAGISSSKVVSFAELLRGDSPEELSAHAEELKQLFGTDQKSEESHKATDPSQGSGNHLPLNGDPLLAAIKGKLNIN